MPFEWDGANNRVDQWATVSFKHIDDSITDSIGRNVEIAGVTQA